MAENSQHETELYNLWRARHGELVKTFAEEMMRQIMRSPVQIIAPVVLGLAVGLSSSLLNGVLMFTISLTSCCLLPLAKRPSVVFLVWAGLSLFVFVSVVGFLTFRGGYHGYVDALLESAPYRAVVGVACYSFVVATITGICTAFVPASCRKTEKESERAPGAYADKPLRSG